MKYYKYISAVIVLSACMLAACQQDGLVPENGDKTLAFSAQVEGMSQGKLTKSKGNTFFQNNDKIDVKITSSNPGSAEKLYEYTYNADGIFKGSYRFPLDDSYIQTLTALWPKQTVRDNGFKTDQRELADYLQADWLTATAELAANGIMPTDVPVPLSFKHENARLEFELVGQNANGLNITSLILELLIDGKATACWAHLNEENGHAEMILPKGIALGDKDKEYMIGRVEAAGTTQYTGTILFPKGIVTLAGGTSYLLTLTPRGDNLIISINFGGWGQDEEGIGVPFQQPTKSADGNFYEIKTPAQLMALSYLIRNYAYNGRYGDTTFNPIEWKDQTYKVMNDLDMTGFSWISIPKNVLPENKLITEGINISNYDILFK